MIAVCVVCGNPFEKIKRKKTCCEACRKKWKLKWQHEWLKNKVVRDKKNARERNRRAELFKDPEKRKKWLEDKLISKRKVIKQKKESESIKLLLSIH